MYPLYEKGKSGLSFLSKPKVNCHWILAQNDYATSRRFLRLPQLDETGDQGIGQDFVHTQLVYIHANDALKDLDEINFADDYLPAGQIFSKSALFLDRDGILIEDTDYPGKIADVKFREEILPVLQHFHKNDFQLIVVTNQSGIARGYYTQDDFYQTTHFIHEHYKKCGVSILDTFHCPYHINGRVPEFARESGYRKPAPGMVLAAAQKHQIDLSRSIMLGDNDSDKLNISCLKSYTMGKKTSDFDSATDFLFFAQQHFSRG